MRIRAAARVEDAEDDDDLVSLISNGLFWHKSSLSLNQVAALSLSLSLSLSLHPCSHSLTSCSPLRFLPLAPMALAALIDYEATLLQLIWLLLLLLLLACNLVG